MTKRQRLVQLKERITVLGTEIRTRQLEDAYLDYAEQLSSRKTVFCPINEEEWEVMLPKEKEKKLLIYYHTARAELQCLTDELKNASDSRGWFETSWTKGILTTGAIMQVAVTVATFLHTMGAFYDEDPGAH